MELKYTIEIKKNSVYNVGGYRYKVLSSGNKTGTVAVLGSTKKSVSSVKVADKVKIGGISFKVTEIAPNAFAKNKKLKSVVIGSNIKTISKNAFYGDGNLKTITIKTKNLRTVGKNALKNINTKAVIKVPSGKYKAYKKLLNKNTGLKNTMKVK